MQNVYQITSDVLAQLINIKKVTIDSELKVAVTIEFIATDEASKENIFKLIRLQGNISEMNIRPAQGEIFNESSTNAFESNF